MHPQKFSTANDLHYTVQPTTIIKSCIQLNNNVLETYIYSYTMSQRETHTHTHKCALRHYTHACTQIGTQMHADKQTHTHTLTLSCTFRSPLCTNSPLTLLQLTQEVRYLDKYLGITKYYLCLQTEKHKQVNFHFHTLLL